MVSDFNEAHAQTVDTRLSLLPPDEPGNKASVCDKEGSSHPLCHCGTETDLSLHNTIQSRVFDVYKYGRSDSDELSLNPS